MAKWVMIKDGSYINLDNANRIHADECAVIVEFTGRSITAINCKSEEEALIKVEDYISGPRDVLKKEVFETVQELLEEEKIDSGSSEYDYTFPKPDWEMLHDQKDNEYWVMISPCCLHESIYFRVRQIQGGKTKGQWFLDHDAEIPMTKDKAKLRFKTLEEAKELCEAEYQAIVSEMTNEKLDADGI